jgi:hypothetical protein
MAGVAGDGAAIDADLVGHVNAAQQRVVIAAMVLTSHTRCSMPASQPSVEAYRERRLRRRTDGPDRRRVEEIDISGEPKALSQWTQIASLLVGKHSTPYQPDSPHDFLHHKVIVSDSTVWTGSYNFAANAENHLVLASASLADRYAQTERGGRGRLPGRIGPSRASRDESRRAASGRFAQQLVSVVAGEAADRALTAIVDDAAARGAPSC